VIASYSVADRDVEVADVARAELKVAKISVSQSSLPFVITPVMPTFRARHPRIDVEIVVEERLVDLVGEGYDAGVRLTESIDRDMVQVRLTDEDLLRHECIGYRARPTGSVYAWELERGRKKWRVPEAYAPSVPGIFLCYPSRAQSSPALRQFVEVAKELLAPGSKSKA
jgi:DNA-binding transcriptional LysR family regulator